MVNDQQHHVHSDECNGGHVPGCKILSDAERQMIERFMSSRRSHS